VKLPRMLDGHRHEHVFVVGGENFPAGGTGESQRISLKLFWHAGVVLPVFHRMRLGRDESGSQQQDRFLPGTTPSPWSEIYQTRSGGTSTSNSFNNGFHWHFWDLLNRGFCGKKYLAGKRSPGGKSSSLVAEPAELRCGVAAQTEIRSGLRKTDWPSREGAPAVC
jgi:hypothetical protein